MAIPWLLALKVIPWGTILANAPSILRSADALRSRAQAHTEPVADNGLQALGDRIAALEQRDRESADLIAQLTAQVAALTTAGEVLEARARWLLVIAVGAVALALLAVGIALFVARAS
jgi:hypothetical protein